MHMALGMSGISTKIKDIRKRHGLDQAEFGAKVGVDQSTVSKWERGLQTPRTEAYLAISNLFGVPLAELAAAAEFTEDEQQVTSMEIWASLKGVVQAGVFISPEEIPEPDQTTLRVPQPSDFAYSEAQAFIVRGNSMNLVYPEGTIVFAIPTIDNNLEPEDGDRVIVQTMNGSGEYEVTIKEYRIDNKGRAILWPRSTDPEFQTPIIIEANHDYVEVQVTGIVITAVLYERAGRRKATPLPHSF